MVALTGTGCQVLGRDCPPAPPEVCLGLHGGEGESDVYGALTKRFMEGPEPPADQKKYQILALSGGGRYGAYTAGVLQGWSDSSTRPTFDIVAGVSVGALLATSAFLGEKYNRRLIEAFVELTPGEVFRRRPIVALAWSNSFASSDPLRRRIAQYVNEEMMDDVAAAHAAGRRLYVGTTNLDTKRLAIWDMGAIAASGRPDRLELFRSVLLASASVPGFLPPVEFPVRLNGTEYTEMHVDGGITSEIFFRLSMLDPNPARLVKGPQPLAGSTVYAIVAGKLFADPHCTHPRIFRLLRESVTSLTAAMTQNDLVRISNIALLTGMNFRFTALRADFPDDDGDSLNFDPKVQRCLYDEGYRDGRRGAAAWRAEPPGFRAAERVIPRARTDFLDPGVVDPWRLRR
jgi:predicted acylesterase/phospholipase RssA